MYSKTSTLLLCVFPLTLLLCVFPLTLLLCVFPLTLLLCVFPLHSASKRPLDVSYITSRILGGYTVMKL